MLSLLPALFLMGGVGGHMVMNTPTPFNLDTEPFLQVNPLNGIKNPYPCQNKFSFAERTPVVAGTTTLVNFTGGAQHGGGSCQFSITYDEPVNGGDWNKSARFMTIYTIIGGCPAIFTDETQNLPAIAADKNMRQDSNHCSNDSGLDCIRQFMIPIPKFLKNGPATFAWTWFNKIGNKEIYMNCAPVYITGGTENEKQMADLPDIFIANYHDDPDVPNCDTGTNLEAVVLNIPNPGRYGRVLQNPTDPSIKPANYCPQIPAASLIPTFEPDPIVAERDAAGETNIPTDGPVFTPTCTGHAPPMPTFTGIITTVMENVTLTPIFTGTIGPDVNEAAVTCTKSQSSETTVDLEFTGRPRDFYHNDGHGDHSSTTVTPIIVVSSLPFGEDPNTTTTGSPEITPPPASTSAPVLFTLTTFPLGHPPVSHGPRNVAYKCDYNGQIICYSETVYGECTWGVAAAGPVPKGFKCKDGRLKPQDDDNVRRADADFEGNDRTVHDMPAEDDPNNKDKKKPKPPVPSPSPRNPFNGNEKRAEGDPNNKDKKKPKPPVPSPSPRNPRDISLGRNRFLPNGTTTTTAAWAHPVPTGYPYNPPRGDAVPCIFQGELICFNSTAVGHCNNGWAVPHILPEDSLCFRGRIIPKPKDQVNGFEPKNPGPGFTSKAKRQSCWTCTQPTIVAVADPQPTDQEDGFKLENAGPSFITKVKGQNCTMPTIAAVAEPQDQVA